MENYGIGCPAPLNLNRFGCKTLINGPPPKTGPDFMRNSDLNLPVLLPVSGALQRTLSSPLGMYQVLEESWNDSFRNRRPVIQ